LVTAKHQEGAALFVNNVMQPLLENPGAFDLVMVTGKYSARVRGTLKALLGVLDRLASGTPFDNQSSAYKIVNQWLAQRSDEFRQAIDAWARQPSLTPLDEELVQPTQEQELEALLRLCDIIKAREEALRTCVASNTMHVVRARALALRHARSWCSCVG